MNFISIGDLALTFKNNRHNVQIKSDLARLTQELASGQKNDLSTAIAGDFAPVIGLERAIRANQAYLTSTTEAGLFASSMQASLGLVQDNISDFSPALLSAGVSESEIVLQTTTADALNKFRSVIGALNTRVADRYVLAGDATDAPPLADAQVMLSDLQLAIAAETTAAGIEAAVDTWFDAPGGGFDTLGYLGSTTSMSAFKLSDADDVQLDLTAENTGIRSALKGFAMAALIGEGALPADTTQRAALSTLAGERLLGAEYDLAILRAEVGSGEAKIGETAAQNAAEKYALDIARTDITAVDPYQTAIELEAVTQQLETLYTLTVRLSRLSLSEYLR